MHGFINSPALAKLVALQMVDEEIARSGRRRRQTRRLNLRARVLARRTARSSAAPAPSPAPRVQPTGALVEDR
jgi:hypothetical protein